jgi:ABC-type multidrug transport system ATPase subunit
MSQISTGERRRVMIAASAARETPYLLLDEPLANLDPVAQREIVEQLLELRRAGRTILLSTHELQKIPQFCDRVYALTCSDCRELDVDNDLEALLVQWSRAGKT